jgi:4-hydroxy-2-oxoheptanedioate aldolase
MRSNPFLDKIRSGEASVGLWLSVPSSITAEVAGRVGYDYVCIDMQHGLIDYSDSVPMLQALTLGGSTTTVRVPWNEPGIIGKVLDAGAMAVIVPMVNTAEDAANALASGKYAPAGSRSSGPIRVEPVEGPDYAVVANDHVQIIPMVETVEAVSNIDAILATPGVEAIYVGPNDLAVSMGFGRDCAEPEFLAQLDHIVARCNEHGVIAGIHCNPSTVTDRLERGFRMVTAQSELTAMRLGVIDALSIGRGADVEDSGGGGY